MTLKAEQIVIQSKRSRKKQKENRIIPNYEEYLTKGHPCGFLSSSPKINNLLKVNSNVIKEPKKVLRRPNENKRIVTVKETLDMNKYELIRNSSLIFSPPKSSESNSGALSPKITCMSPLSRNLALRNDSSNVKECLTTDKKNKAEVRLKISSNSVLKQGVTPKGSSKGGKSFYRSPSHRLSDVIEITFNKKNFVSDVKKEEQKTQIIKNLF